MVPYLGEIRMFSGNYAPQGWALCNGQILQIASNSALFSLIGITYGGNGQTNFALPNLQGRAPVHAGQSLGGSNYALGEMTGVENVTLTGAQMPAHVHPSGPASVSSGNADQNSPVGNVPAVLTSGRTQTPAYTSPANANGTGATPSTQTGVSGGSQPFSVLQPLLVVNFIIALQGIYPPRP